MLSCSRLLAYVMEPRALTFTGRPWPPVAPGIMVLKCEGAVHVLQLVQKACPNQACSLQGSCGVSCSSLAVNDLGTGSGWQQSKQNWTLLAVVGIVNLNGM